MSASVRTNFDRQLAVLRDSVLGLGSMARHALVEAMRALEQGDADLAREIIAQDTAANKLRYEIERQCYTLLATEQPVAGDMRRIVAALIIVNDLERIADHGKKIARIALRLLENPHPVSLGGLVRMYELALSMLDRALDAFSHHDTAQAEAVCRDDDQLDALYKQTFNVLLSYMLENPTLIGQCTQLLQVGHELERVGDRATNVGERVIYAVTGKLIDLND